MHFPPFKHAQTSRLNIAVNDSVLNYIGFTVELQRAKTFPLQEKNIQQHDYFLNNGLAYLLKLLLKTFT